MAAVGDENFNDSTNFNRQAATELTLNENNSIVQRFQETLKHHLLKHKEKLIFDRQELNKNLNAAQREREELGCKLYSVQEKLTTCTAKLQTLTNRCVQLESKRPTLEGRVEAAKKTLSDVLKALQVNKSEETELLHNVSLLNKRLHHLESSKDLQQSDVAVLRQATKKVNTECSRLEADKRKQDAHVSRLLNDVQKLQEKISLHEERTKIIYEEANQIRGTLSKARMEIDTIRLEGKHLLDQWNNSLGKMQTRDESLSSLQETFITQQGRFQMCQSEIRSIEKSVMQEEALTKTLSTILKRFNTDINSLTNQLTQDFEKQESVRLEITSLKCALQEMQLSIDAQKNIKIWKDAECKDTSQILESIISEKNQLHHALNEKILNSNWVDKSVLDISKQTQIIQQDITKLDDIKAKEQSEFMKLQLDSTRLQTQIKQLKNNLEYYKAEICTKEKEFKEKEINIKKCIDMIDKNQRMINELRCKIETTSSQIGFETGPSELRLNSLERDLEQTLIESQTLQSTWLKQQKTLVKVLHEKAMSMTEIRHLDRQLSIYSQRKFRSEEEIHRVESDCQHLHKTIDNLHKRVSLTNKQVHVEHTEEETLARVTILTEDDLFRSLTNDENELISLKENLERLKDEEEKLSQKLLDAESDLLQWQGKFHIMKEVKSNTETEYKKGEIYELQQNLHKMQVQYSGICRQHSHFAQEMEQAVHRWDALLTKGEIQLATGSTGTTIAPLKRNIEDIRKRINITEKDIEGIERKINATILQYDFLNQQIQLKDSDNNQMKSTLMRFDNDAKDVNCERVQNLEHLVIKQHQSKYYQSILEMKYQPLCQSQDAIGSEMEKHTLWAVKLSSVLKDIMNEFPNLLCELEPIELQQIARLAILQIKQQ